MTPRGKKKLLQIGNILAVMITILINALAVLLPLNNKTTQELSDALPNLFVPAGITFSIWSIIYILWVAFAVYQARDLFKKVEIEMPFMQQITVLFIMSSVANSTWIFLWHYEYIGLSVLMMIILLFSLLAIYLRLNIGRSNVTMTEKIFVHVPISVYLGWITVATIANVTAFLVFVKWDGLGISPVIWTILVISVGVLITLLMLALRKDIAYSLVVLWALLGIWIKQTSPGFTNNDVATLALIAMVLISVGILVIIGFNLIKKKKPQPENPPAKPM
ncbi:MAG TPA: hypothetical protein VMY59_10315 [Candidatus Thermoplasmatota archaeon]|nr:hypothetical protein [Candidatus Thermoplasmatota archaeon]